MNKTDIRYSEYISILHEELVPAMGCTEPIAIAYAAAMAKKILGTDPERVVIEISDNIIKNVKSVVVPNTGNLKGIEAAAAAGIAAGDANKVLEVISEVNDEGRKAIATFLKTKEIKIQSSKSGLIFDLIVNVYSGESSASVRISHFHTNIVRITKDGKTTFYNPQCNDINKTGKTDRSLMNVEDIIDFAESVDISEVKDVLQKQIDYNSAIAEEGIRGEWGASIGSVILKTWDCNDIKIRAKAMAAAGSDARMSGCELPVIIVSGSGNQGLTASVPVIEYARELKADRETLYRALIISNLITIHLKTGIGSLSAYCGAVSAGMGAGSGITWLCGGRYKEVAHTIVNGLAIVSGIICDGAKPSCAGKVATAVEAGILGYHMYKNGKQIYAGEGIVEKGVENTIKNIGRLGSTGMRETDKEIIRIMLGK
ncbi:MAG TPA: L-serine ammonia-lyase, iron-sulfur-dependent, subunit alpha [Spirochaetota bacterium]|nr:L-serine ammonia-lyase, iron-sulfur-dependent, subunit alpha [Spirochaetota bacterium]HPJ36683.1 L-serine ammonia-lyase, iron-sulfur-dependent, subunit alpha [Spirochaetota bacterium]